jgi:thiamine-phosphate diphosphorylase
MTPRQQVRHKVHGLYGIADAFASGGDPVGLATWLLAGGCKIIQIRCKGWSTADVRDAAIQIRQRCHAVDALCLINDHPSLVLEVGADGVHVGQLDGDDRSIRALVGPDHIVGRSTHTLEQVEQALPAADYIGFGPIFSTPHLSVAKPERGLEALRAAADAVQNRCPLVAIGGLTPDHVPELKGAGAQAWATIGHIANAADPTLATRCWTQRS